MTYLFYSLRMSSTLLWYSLICHLMFFIQIIGFCTVRNRSFCVIFTIFFTDIPLNYLLHFWCPKQEHTRKEATDNKRDIQTHKTKINYQRHSKTNRRKRQKDKLQYTKLNIKYEGWVSRPPTKAGSELRYSRKVHGSCFKCNPRT